MTQKSLDALMEQEQVQSLYVYEMEYLELFHLVDDDENMRDWLQDKPVYELINELF